MNVRVRSRRRASARPRMRIPRWSTEWPRPTARGLAFLVSSVLLFFAASILVRRDLAFVASLALALPVVALLLVALRRPKLSVDRRFDPETAVAGSDCEVSLLVRNWSRVPTPAAAWFDTAVAPLLASTRETLPSLRGFRSLESDTPGVHRVRYVLETPTRGVHTIGPFVVRWSDPFGFAVRYQRVGGGDELVVTPAVSPLARGSFRLPTGDGHALQARTLAVGGAQDVIARKYQTGDSIRRIHWPATARHSELMVRQDDQQNEHHATVLLDSLSSSYPPGASAEFEWAVSMAVSIAHHLLGEGYLVRLVPSAVGLTGAAWSERHGQEVFEEGRGAELLLRAARFRVRHTEISPVAHDPVPDAGTAPGELSPVFAVLGHMPLETVASMAAAAASASFALAVVVVPADESDARHHWAERMRETLETAGWVVRLASSADVIAEVWDRAGTERMAS